MLSGELATLLSGRYQEIVVHALSFPEFLEFHNIGNTNESLMMYLKFGGLPNLIHLPMDEEIVFDYLGNIYASILFKDVVKRYNIRNVSFLENLVSFLAGNLGSIVSAKKISDFLKSQQIRISPNMVLDYLSYLSSAFFIHKTRRQDIVGKKIFEIGEKYYFGDIGWRNSISGFNIRDIGKVIENAIFTHLSVQGYAVNVGVSGNTEIDFVAQKKGEKLYVQACYLLHDQSTIDREFGNLLAIKDNYPKVVVSMDDAYGKTSYEGIQHLHLKNFLSGSET
jgi:predicted AAA+ superfamily ATPase